MDDDPLVAPDHPYLTLQLNPTFRISRKFHEGLKGKHILQRKHFSLLHVKVMKKQLEGTSLVGQWMRIHLPMQGDVGLIPGPGRSHLLHSNSDRVQQLLKPMHLALCSTTKSAAKIN